MLSLDGFSIARKKGHLAALYLFGLYYIISLYLGTNDCLKCFRTLLFFCIIISLLVLYDIVYSAAVFIGSK